MLVTHTKDLTTAQKQLNTMVHMYTIICLTHCRSAYTLCRCIIPVYMYIEIHVHSTLAKEYNGRKVIPTQTNKGTHIKVHIYVHHTQEIENCIEK